MCDQQEPSTHIVPAHPTGYLPALPHAIHHQLSSLLECQNQEFWTLLMEKFSKELLWRAGLFFALYDEFHLAKKGIKLLKIIPC